MLGLAPLAGAPIAALRASPTFDHTLRASGSITVSGNALGQNAAAGVSGGQLLFAPAVFGTITVIAEAKQVLPLLGTAAVSLTALGQAGTAIQLQGAGAGAGRLQGRARDLFGFTGAAHAAAASRAQLRVGLFGSGALPVSCSGAGNVSSDAAASGISALHMDICAALAIRSNARGSVALVLATHAATGIASRAAVQVPSVLCESRATAAVNTAVHAAIWPIAGAAVGYRAPPALRRHAPPDHSQGGNLAPSLRTGRVLKG